MRHRFSKLFLLIMVFVLLFVMIAPGSATAKNGADFIRQQIRRTYSKALSMFDRSSFDGYCGTLTGYQLYIMGITARPDLKNGKDGYDTYCHQKISTGGYRIRPYPAKSWTLLEALNDITDNGTQDAFNILVGFQSTPSSRGGKFGHSCVIHGIIDGQVYFMESYDVKLNGMHYKEGTPISCSIADFCEYYKSTTTKFDGVIHFGAKDYVDLCHSFPSSFNGVTVDTTELRSQPCTQEADGRSVLLSSLSAGEQVHIIRTVENTQGEYWYEITGELEGYVSAKDIQANEFLFDDITSEKIKAPTVLRSGKGYKIKGEVLSDENTIYTLRAQVYRINDQILEPVLAVSEVVDGKSYNLGESYLDEQLKLSTLSPGRYRYELAAVVGNYYYLNQQLTAQWKTVSLWNSDFCVTEEQQKAVVVTFESFGAQLELDSRALIVGEAIGALPVIARSGYVFNGWYTRPTGGEKITESFVPTENTVAYPQWSSIQSLEDSMTNADEYWYVYVDGMSAIGCARVDGTVYYFANPDTIGHGGLVWSIAH